MVAQWQKRIAKEPHQKQERLNSIVEYIVAGDTAGLKAKPLEGHPGCFRCRV